MGFVFLFIILFYTMVLVAIGRKWTNGENNVAGNPCAAKKALLVPFRNEAIHLPAFLGHLKEVAAAVEEVLFIDDHSEDESAALISDFIAANQLPNWILLKNDGIGKKAALTKGVCFSQAQIILTTDVDCLLPSNWVAQMMQPFQRMGTQLVAGPVLTKEHSSFFQRFQQIEWSSIILTTSYFFDVGRPIMCSGANLAYRKSAFLAVQGYVGNENYASGDDEFLLKKIVDKYGAEATIYQYNSKVLVWTQALPHFSALLQQRVRWAGKWSLHQSAVHAMSAIATFLLSLIAIASLALLFGPSQDKMIFIIFWVLKIGVEKRVLGKVLANFRCHPSLYDYVATSFLHPIYVIIVGLGTLRGKYNWKGRDIYFRF